MDGRRFAEFCFVGRSFQMHLPLETDLRSPEIKSDMETVEFGVVHQLGHVLLRGWTQGPWSVQTRSRSP